MAGYKLQGKNSAGDILDIPIAATYDIDGEPIKTTYAIQTGSYPNLTAGKALDSDKLGGVAASGYAKIALVNGKLDKVTSGNSQRAYCVDAANNQAMIVVANATAAANSIAQRGAGGVLVVGEPTAAGHAATKNYVDTGLNGKANTTGSYAGLTVGKATNAEQLDGIAASGYAKTSGNYPSLSVGKATNAEQLGGVAASGYVKTNDAILTNKLDKVTSGNSQRAYCVSSANAQSMIVVSSSAIADSIAQRGAGGVLVVGEPTATNHAATKAYIDTGLSGKANTSGNYPGITAGAAAKLTVNGGDSDTPVYFVNGVPTACAATLGVSITGNAATADKLKTARTLQVSLASAAGASFDGSENVTDIGVSGTLGLGNGGTGATTANAAMVKLMAGITSKTSSPASTEYIAAVNSNGTNVYAYPFSKVRDWLGSNGLVTTNTAQTISAKKTFSVEQDFASINLTSDRRLKKNIKPYTSQKSILDVEVKEFEWLDEKAGKGKQIGVIAQELQKYFPELVVEGEDGYLRIKETKLVYLLMQEVRRLRDEVNGLKEDR